MAIYSQSSD